jgi:asparagine synthase (glutamine-hydrolysing)
MVSDVPLGAFLSGGLDSSTVVALMQAESERPVKTFSIGFREADFDEAPHARAVAEHLGTDHHEMTVTPAEAQAVIPELPRIYDEPFADVSQIPTYLVSRLARERVTVSLSGDGGDELFAGYHRYPWGRRLYRLAALAPRGVRALAADGLTAVPVERWNRTATAVQPLLPARLRHGQAGDKLHKLAGLLAAVDPPAMYRLLLTLWPQPRALVPGAGEAPTVLDRPEEWPDLGGFVEQMMLLDMLHYLPNDILVKLDRAAMAVSLEGRVPLLDHRVVEFAWRLPLDLKLRGGESKWLLRRVLYRHVPQHLLERPKMGFGVPIGDWLRGDLRDWAEELLDERHLADGGLLDPAPVRRAWRNHLNGHRNWHYLLWPVLMLQAWRRAEARPQPASAACPPVSLSSFPG